MSNVADRLMKGSLLISLSRAIVNGLSSLSTIILAWYLMPSDFGIVALATTMLAIVTTVTDLSLSQALIRHENPQESHFSAAWTLGATRGLLLCLVFAGIAYPSSVIYNDPRLFDVMLALSLSLLINGLANPKRFMLQRDLIFWQEFVLNVVQKIAGFVATVAVAVIYQSYWALVVGTLVMQATNVITSYMVLPFRPRITFRHMREFVSFSVWLTAGQIVNTLNWRFDYLLTGKYLDSSALGYYSLGSTLAMMPTRETTAPLTATIYPGFSNVRNDPQRLANAYQRAQAMLAAIALPAGIGFAVVGDPLVRLALGERWIDIVPIIQALASVYALQTLGSLVQPLGMALGKTRTLFIRDTQMLIIRVPIIAAGLLLYGLQGLVICRVFTGLLSAVINMFIVKKFVGVSVLVQLAANFRALFSSALMAAGVYAVLDLWGPVDGLYERIIQLAALIALGGVIYCGSTFLLWVLAKRPTGPETEIQKLVVKILTKLRGRG